MKLQCGLGSLKISFSVMTHYQTVTDRKMDGQTFDNNQHQALKCVEQQKVME